MEIANGFWGATFQKLRSALSKTKSAVIEPAIHPNAQVQTQDFQPSISIVVNDEYLEELEEKLIKADLGLSSAQELVGHLRQKFFHQSIKIQEIETFLKGELSSILRRPDSPVLNIQPQALSIILIVGVNGTGKTTSIGKLCFRLVCAGNKVLIAAGDTFRAAAESQLEIWAKRAGADILRLSQGTDPAAVVYQAIDKAKQEKYDVLVIDTAGRLHNKVNLMAELKKVRSVIDKHAFECPLEVLLVMDASTGQNGLSQARIFTESCPLTGVILTKLDGTARGGVVFSIARDLNLPVKLIGIGEQIDDLKDFEANLFVEALFE